jgi:hypothetical protein
MAVYLYIHHRCLLIIELYKYYENNNYTYSDKSKYTTVLVVGDGKTSPDEPQPSGLFTITSIT